MKAGGIGGFEVQPVYPLDLDDPVRGFRNLPFQSPEFFEMLGYTAAEAKRQGLRFDLTLGSGWPYGGPSVPVTEAAGRLRVVKSTRKPGQTHIPPPSLAHGETVIAVFSGGKRLPDPQRVDSDDAVFFLSSRTGMMVKRPSAGAEGFVLDHYDPAALRNYLRATGDPLLRAVKDNPPEMIFCDSLEVFGSDWTPGFLDEFRRLRGYDLTPFLPMLLPEDRSAEARGVRHDWGRTLTELLEANFLEPLARYAKANGTRLRIQNYGIPPATLNSNRFGDVSEGEGVDWKEVRAARWAASANRHFNRPVTTSETFTWLHSPSFRATPLDIKAEADIHFLQGVNQIIMHGWPYNAEDAAAPGWRFYAAGAFNDRNPWWMVMPGVSRYLQRVSWLLRQGEAVRDVALYLPNTDAWSGFTAGNVHMIETLRALLGKTVMPAILDSGYGLDFIDDGTLGSLSRYKVLVLPGVETMPVESIPALENFVKRGGAILSTRRLPSRAPGRMASPADHARVGSALRRLAKLVPDDDALPAALSAACPSDLKMAARDPEIGFVHRRTGSGDYYFVANTGNSAKQLNVSPRDALGRSAAFWDPVTGARSGAGAGELTLELEPYGSRVIAFEPDAPEPASAAPLSRSIDLRDGWSLAFPGKEARPAGLVSWTEDTATLFFSGAAVYGREFHLPGAPPARAELDFGPARAIQPQPRKNGLRAWLEPPVREAAEVFVNGQRAGAVWCPPYRLEIGSFLKQGANQLRIVVANTAMNHMAGNPLPDYRLLNLRYGTRFEPQDMDQVRPLPSGLLAPVVIRLSELQASTRIP